MEISTKKLFIAVSLVVMLGALITVFSIYHTLHMGNAFLQYPLFLYGTAILSLLSGGFIVYLFEDRINKAQLNKILSVLPPDERKIMKILAERVEIEQNKLVTLSGLNKVRVSRILATLEQRKIIEKKKHGYTNMIILKI
ncbi:MAG: hypothetical protein GXO64_02435 [Candidatus Micrarchaeota archaeon]|nr:hypothetical protein [Candidatus Micrarchaeota archaeon]